MASFAQSDHPIQQQPTGTPSMMAPSTAPLHPVTAQPGQFSTGLFACQPVPFIYSCFCPCLSYGENKQRLTALNDQHRALPKDEIETLDSNALVFLAVNCAVGLGCLMDMIQRGNVRKRYSIEGSDASDFCQSWCCLPCSQQQQARELTREEAALFEAQGFGPGGAGAVPGAAAAGVNKEGVPGAEHHGEKH